MIILGKSAKLEEPGGSNPFRIDFDEPGGMIQRRRQTYLYGGVSYPLKIDSGASALDTLADSEAPAEAPVW